MVYYWARTMPLRPAIIEPEGIVTYGGLAQSVENAAKYFAGDIVDRSRPVAVSLSGGAKTAVAVLGLLRGGYDVVLSYTAVLKYLESEGVNTLVCERDGMKLDSGAHVLFDDRWIAHGIRGGKLDKPLPRAGAKDGKILCFTSGTTGRPKIIVCPERSWQERLAFPLNSAFSNYERILIVPGIANSWGFSRAYEALYQGRTICLAPIPQTMLRMINSHDIDTILASPSQALELVSLQEKSRAFSLPSLQAVHLGAAPINRDGIQRIRNSLCRNIVMIYGSTEAGVAAVAPFDMIADVPGAVGFIVPGVNVEIVDTMDRVLPMGEEGFVRIHSLVLTENQATNDPHNRWFYPGDVGRLTETGMLCIAGRIGDVLNRGGNKLSVTDFEDFLRSCHGIKDAGVCKVVGQSGFEEGWVAIVIEPDLDTEAFRHMIDLNKEFGPNADKIFVVESIPRGQLGKIKRDELKKILLNITEAENTPAPQP